MKWFKTTYLYLIMLACFGVFACSPYDSIKDIPDQNQLIDFDRPESFDIYVDTTGPNGFFAQAEQHSFYTSREAYEQAAPELYAYATQVGLPLRFVFGPQMRAEMKRAQGSSTNNVSLEAYTWGFKLQNFYVSISLPEKAKPLGGCIGQDAYYTNLRIHYIDAYSRGTQLRDYHFAAYSRFGDAAKCLAIYESEKHWSYCSCPGPRVEHLFTTMQHTVLQGYKDIGMSQYAASLMAAVTVPILMATLILVGG